MIRSEVSTRADVSLSPKSLKGQDVCCIEPSRQVLDNYKNAHIEYNRELSKSKKVNNLTKVIRLQKDLL